MSASQYVNAHPVTPSEFKGPGPISQSRLRFAAAQYMMTLGPLLDNERQAMVYALVCLRPGENYHYYQQNAWPSPSGQVYGELEVLAKRKLIWYS